MKKIKIIILSLLIILLIFVFYLYFSKEKEETITNKLKTYKVENIEFSTTRNLKKTSYENFSISYIDPVDNLLILGLKESNESLEKLKIDDLTLEKYTNILYENQKNTLSKIEKRSNYYYFTYSFTNENQEKFAYLITTYKKNNNYYLINFVSKYDEFDIYKEEFLQIADTVKIK